MTKTTALTPARTGRLLLLVALATMSHFSGAFAQEEAAASPKPKAQRQETRVAEMKISSTKGATFNSKENTAEFRGDVVVIHPGFTMTSDKLLVYLKADQSGMDRAVATGYVTIRKNGDEGGKNYYVGKARHATFNGDAQTVHLTDWPQIQQNNSLHIATARDTVMKLDKEGTLITDGLSRTVLPDHKAAGDTGEGVTAAGTP